MLYLPKTTSSLTSRQFNKNEGHCEGGFSHLFLIQPKQGLSFCNNPYQAPIYFPPQERLNLSPGFQCILYYLSLNAGHNVKLIRANNTSQPGRL